MEGVVYDGQVPQGGDDTTAIDALATVCVQEAYRLRESEDTTKLNVLASMCADAPRAEPAAQPQEDDVVMTDLPDDTTAKVEYFGKEAKEDADGSSSDGYNSDDTFVVQRPSEEVQLAQQQVHYAQNRVVYTNAEVDGFQQLVNAGQAILVRAEKRLEFDQGSLEIAKAGHKVAQEQLENAQEKADMVITGADDDEDEDNTPDEVKDPCPRCNKLVKDLEAHMALVHGNSRKLRLEAMSRATRAVLSGTAVDYPCPWCKNVYKNSTSLGKHMASKHSSGPQQHPNQEAQGRARGHQQDLSRG
ncbi:uncharacterized protein BP5553_02561 [Venustampulla echinocandica]|uniref:C2H2-type domain-containing protein n=1 Tax=Venustampulla echinocandica TaxID=2656787 RepID=A0A370TRS9_9HELO|nr:uncharacterized protein BP5553_02561 [Venustampulla echinocandica]RDL38221.1 hypothetical protein BP5553_02561 [Venustampulla echinocandica]